jgi:hypothetical protein
VRVYASEIRPQKWIAPDPWTIFGSSSSLIHGWSILDTTDPTPSFFLFSCVIVRKMIRMLGVGGAGLMGQDEEKNVVGLAQ